MEWDVPEHLYSKKTNDWYAAVIVITGVLVALEFFYGNFLFLMLTVVTAISIILLASREPNMMHVSINKSGVRAGSTFYPFSTLDAFGVIDHPREHKLLLESAKTYLPLIVIPVPDEIDREEVWEILSNYLPAKELREPMAHVIFEYLGF